MVITEDILNFLTTNSYFSSQSAVTAQKFTYSSGWVITPGGSKKGHKLTIDGRYKLEKSDALHPNLLNCLQNKKEIVYFQSKRKLEFSDAFVFFGGEGSYWTFFPKADYDKCLASQDYANRKTYNESYEEEHSLENPEIRKREEIKETNAQEWLDKN